MEDEYGEQDDRTERLRRSQEDQHQQRDKGDQADDAHRALSQIQAQPIGYGEDDRGQRRIGHAVLECTIQKGRGEDALIAKDAKHVGIVPIVGIFPLLQRFGGELGDHLVVRAVRRQRGEGVVVQVRVAQHDTDHAGQDEPRGAARNIPDEGQDQGGHASQTGHKAQQKTERLGEGLADRPDVGCKAEGDQRHADQADAQAEVAPVHGQGPPPVARWALISSMRAEMAASSGASSRARSSTASARP